MKTARQSRPEHARFLVALLVAVMALGLALSPGAVRGAVRHREVASLRQGARPASEPKVCAGCQPPLTYQGGPVLTTTGAGLTVTPIFWVPPGYSLPSGYQSIVDTFVTNVAAASGSTDNVFSISTEYYYVSHGVKSYAAYKIKAGTPIVDSHAFPSSGCTALSDYSACISDAQIRTELSSVLAAHHLPSTLADFYPVFFPPKVETEDLDGSNSVSSFCGYHRSYGPSSAQTIYANMPFEESGCDAGQAPNGNLQADGAVSTLTHELVEALTDPIGNSVAWVDKAGNEIGDECAQSFGRPLGSTSASSPSSTEYNQVINGGKYYLQELFSDFSYGKYGLDHGCTQSEALAQHPSAAGTGAGTTTVASVFSDATPTTLPADGTSTSKVVAIVGDSKNFSVQGDHVHFTTGVESGQGVCGTLSSADATTDANGYATVTYTASTSNVTCWVLAVDSEGGLAAQSVIFQGTTQKQSPDLTAAFPPDLTAGTTSTFSMKETNPGSAAVPDVRIDLQVFAGSSSSPAVNASQMQLSYSTTGPNGSYTPVTLTGSTADGNVISGVIGTTQGTSLKAGSSTPLTLQVTLNGDVTGSHGKPLLAFEAYLDQINSASGSGATLADTFATNTSVKAAPPSSGIAWWWWLVIAAGVALLAALIVALVRRGRRGSPAGPPTPQPA